MCKGDLFELVTNQKISKCVVQDGLCCFHLRYREFNFCVSEILKQSCQLEKLKKIYQEKGKIDLSLPLIQEMGDISTKKKDIEFGVYYQHPITHSILHVGNVIERRKKERGNNLRDLLKKAIMEFSDRVEDPSALFLLGS